MAGGDSDGGSPTDTYASQSASIRDTAKWMGVGYGAVAAVFIAGAPFSGIASLEPWRLILAVVAGIVALGAFLSALNEILKFLIGYPCFASGLSADAKAYIDAHAEDILPARFRTFDEFYLARKGARTMVRDMANELSRALQSGKVAEIAAAQEKLDAASTVSNGFESVLATLVSEAHLHQLHRRLDEMRRCLAVLTVVGAAALFIAVWAAKPPKPSDSGHVRLGAGLCADHGARKRRPPEIGANA